MQELTLRDLLEVGAYYGHKKELSHPKAQKFIYTIKDGVNIINLEETIKQAKKATQIIKDVLAKGQKILFVGTKQQSKEAIKNTATKVKMPYVVWRWLGGTMTNFDTIKARINNYLNLEKELKSEEAKKYTKKEKVRLEKELAKLDKFFFGLKEMQNLPGLLFIIDPLEEHVALEEAKKLKIPVIAICNTNVNIDKLDCPIPANDNAPKTINLICDYITNFILANQKVSKK